MPRFLVAAIALLLLSLAPTPAARAAPVRVTGELLLNTDNLKPGQQGIAAVVATIADGWHTQSSRPLEKAYIPFVVTTAATANVKVEDALYAPGDVADFPALGGKLSVYHGRVLAFVPFVVPADAKLGDEVRFDASVRYQACNDELCERPTTLKLSVTAKVAADAKSTNDAVFAQFDPMRYLHEQPLPVDASTQPTSAAPTSAQWVKYSDAALAEARATGKPVIIDFTAAWCVNCHVVERRVYGDADTLAKLHERGATLLKADLTADGAPGSALLAKLNPARSIPFTAVYFPGKETPAGLTGIYSSSDLLATLADNGKTATSATSIAGYDLASAPLAMKLLIAIGVGVLLNAVPCVLPVLPLKAMSFYEDAGHDRGRSMLNGGLFSLGIVATFGALALFVITQDALWGKFISSKYVAAGLTLVLLAAATQAFGFFEFVLPRSVTNLEGKTGGTSLAANFFSGMLIVVLSTPCTIGVFAAVIAVAIKSGAALGSLMLMFVGVGMSLPWFALSAFPEATRQFPRTGPWPGVVKQMTGFLLVATAIFFAAPLVPRAGNALWWLIFACVAASALFLIVRTTQLAPRPRPLAIASCVALVLVGIGLTLTLAVVG